MRLVGTEPDTRPTVDPDDLGLVDAPHIDRASVGRHDSVVFTHPSRPTRPITGQVTAVGQHGVTVRGPNGHKVVVRWGQVVGHAPAIHHAAIEGIAGLPDASSPLENPKIVYPKVNVSQPPKAAKTTKPQALTTATGQPKEDPAASSLRKALRPPEAHGEEIPETYLAQLAQGLGTALHTMAETTQAAVGRWFAARLSGTMDGAKSEALKSSPLLGTDDLDELAALIRTTFRAHLGGDVPPIPVVYKTRWQVWKVTPDAPDTPLARYADDAFTYGGMQRILKATDTLDEARTLAKNIQPSRVAQLAQRTIQGTVGNFLRAWEDGYAEATFQAADGHNRQLLNDLIAAYVRGDLRAADTPPTGLSPEEQAAASGTRRVTDLDALTDDLARRWDAVGDRRDWGRVARSEVRRVSNIGTLYAIQEYSPDARVYFQVGPDACARCTDSYLEPGGRPRTFALQDLLAIITKTGGVCTDYHGPNALRHPDCACRLMRVPVAGVPGGTRLKKQ